MTAPAVAVLGAGNWGTTLAHLVAGNGRRVWLWTRTREQADEVNDRHTNEHYAPGLAIDHKVKATEELERVLGECPLALLVVPSQAFREVCRRAGDVLRPDHVVLHATKGLERGTHRRMTEILLEETCVRLFGVVSGPNIAPEIAAGKPAGTVVASHVPRVVELGREVLTSRRFMTFAGDDVCGIELAGALKNVVALAAGMAEAMDVGENAKALLVTRGLAEISRLSFAMGARPATFGGLAGIGDLMVTCASRHSRNHRVGEALARGESLESVTTRLGMVAEGVHTVVSARELATLHDIEAPVVDRVHRVLYEGLAPQAALEELMALRTGRDVARYRGT